MEHIIDIMILQVILGKQGMVNGQGVQAIGKFIFIKPFVAQVEHLLIAVICGRNQSAVRLI
jgi:hypothetical protein